MQIRIIWHNCPTGRFHETLLRIIHIFEEILTEIILSHDIFGYFSYLIKLK